MKSDVEEEKGMRLRYRPFQKRFTINQADKTKTRGTICQKAEGGRRSLKRARFNVRANVDACRTIIFGTNLFKMVSNMTFSDHPSRTNSRSNHRHSNPHLLRLLPNNNRRKRPALVHNRFWCWHIAQQGICLLSPVQQHWGLWRREMQLFLLWGTHLQDWLHGP